jgi:hypothetical protein
MPTFLQTPTFIAASFAAIGLVASPMPAIAAVSTRTSGGSTIIAASCSFSAVQIAAASAALGQTVMIPQGDCDWGANQLTLSAGVTLKGAGRDLTVLRRTAQVPVNTYVIKFDCWNGKQAALSDMTLVGAMLPHSEDRGLGLINGCVDFKVANAKFTRFTFAGVEVRGATRQRGVIYKSQFINNYNPALRNLGYGVIVLGDGTWPALELGSANAVFVENNYMLGNRHHIASNNGARYVFRYNTAEATDATKDYAQVDAHGLSSSPQGTRSWEIYGNSFLARLSGAAKAYAGIGMRGGDGIIANNSFSSNIAMPIVLQLEFGVVCGSSYVQNQIRDAYVWSNVNASVTSACPLSIAINRDYFTFAKPNYKAYIYPHPLRSI